VGPAGRDAAALFRDIERIVTLTEATGWSVDRLAVEDALPDALQSVCRVEQPARDELVAWLDARIAAEGGDPEAAWRARGKRLAAIEALLELARVRLVLGHALEAAARDCPFWIEARPGFRSRQVSDDRWQLSFGGGGTGILAVSEGQADLKAGGAGRLLFGRQLGARWVVQAGLESGGSAAFPKNEAGDRGRLVLAFDSAVLTVVRHHFLNTYVEGEAGYLVRFTEDDRDLVNGFKLGAAIGGRAARRRWLLPGVAFGVSYERTLPSDGQGPALNQVKIGFRVAVDVDL
jgi:hypothetical protein